MSSQYDNIHPLSCHCYGCNGEVETVVSTIPGAFATRRETIMIILSLIDRAVCTNECLLGIFIVWINYVHLDAHELHE